MTDDEQKIRNVVADWMIATNTGNLPRILELMDEDVVFLVSGQMPMRGRDAFAASYKKALQNFTIDGTIDIQEIQVFGAWAYCWNYLTVTITPKSPNLPPAARSGPILSVFRKRSDQSWVLYRDANMLTVKPAADAA